MTLKIRNEQKNHNQQGEKVNSYHTGLRNVGAPGWLSQLSIPASVQVMISLFLGFSPVLGSVLTAWSLELL